VTTGGEPARACPECLARAWLLARLSSHLDRVRDRIDALLALGDDALIGALAGRAEGDVRREREAFDPADALAQCAAARLAPICRCDPGYPVRLTALTAPPALLYIGGVPGTLDALADSEPVAVVGARRASPYGLEVARALGRGLGAAGVPVVSGMALGIDGAAHGAALEAGGVTVAVLAASPERAYPASARVLHRRIVAAGAVVSELGPGVAVRRWMFPARNRIIAALSAMTVVVAARERSGGLVTARVAGELGRTVGAVPGQVTAPLARGTHRLLRAGATLIRGPEDVLDALYGAASADGGAGGGRQGGGTRTRLRPRAAAGPRPPALAPELGRLLDALADGHPVSEAFAQAELGVDAGLAALAALELSGRVRRQPGGRFLAMPWP
jgi:DNA processing protein